MFGSCFEGFSSGFWLFVLPDLAPMMFKKSEVLVLRGCLFRNKSTYCLSGTRAPAKKAKTVESGALWWPFSKDKKQLKQLCEESSLRSHEITRKASAFGPM